MILIDTNALVVLLVGLVDTRLFKTHKRTSVYDEWDFNELVNKIPDTNQLVILPNVWTETDNLLNDFGGDYKYSYIQEVSELIKSSTEKYLPTTHAIEHWSFLDLGVTDSLLLHHSTECKLLITADSKLSDYALASGICVYDMKKSNTERLKLSL